MTVMWNREGTGKYKTLDEMREAMGPPTNCSAYFSWPPCFGTACQKPPEHDGPHVWLVSAWAAEAYKPGGRQHNAFFDVYLEGGKEAADELASQPWDAELIYGD